jgi:hypothetical protein
MDEYVLAAVVGLNKSIALGGIEPLYSACRHAHSLPLVEDLHPKAISYQLQEGNSLSGLGMMLETKATHLDIEEPAIFDLVVLASPAECE